jgi:hypothetical protein
VGAESIEWFIEGQDFSRSYNLAPRPPPHPSFAISSTRGTHEDWERETSCWWKRGGKGVGEEPNHTINNKKNCAHMFLLFMTSLCISSITKLYTSYMPLCTLLPANFQQSTKNSEQCVWGRVLGQVRGSGGGGHFQGRYMGEKRQVAAPKSISRHDFPEL